MTLSSRTRTAAILAVIAVGAAQLFRSPVEVAVGAGFIAAALLWAVMARRGDWYGIGVAKGLIAVVLAARACSAPLGTASTWHGAVIVVVNWGAWGCVFAWLARSHMRAS